MLRKYFTGKYIALYLILALGLVLRVWFISEHLHYFKLWGDAGNYHLMSHQIVDDGIYGYGLGHKSVVPNAYVPPVYPLFLSVIYSIFHDPYLQITVVRLAQAFIGGIVTPFLSYSFVKRLFKVESAAVLTAFFTAVYPTYIESTFYLLTEVISLASMLLYFYLTVMAFQKKSRTFGLLAGAAFAINILVRPAMLPLYIIPFIYAFFVWGIKEYKKIIVLFAFCTIGFVVIMSPWWIRNFVVLDRIILTSTGSGNPLLAGTYPDMENMFLDAGKNAMRNSVTQAAYAKERIIKGFTTQPLLYFKWYTLGKVRIMFQKPWLYIQFPEHRFFQNLFHYLFIWVGLVGIIINSIFNKTHRLVYLYGIMFLGLYLIFIPVDRYAYQHMFFLILATAFVICYSVKYLMDYVKKINT